MLQKLARQAEENVVIFLMQQQIFEEVRQIRFKQ